jgi:hypothetical protein
MQSEQSRLVETDKLKNSDSINENKKFKIRQMECAKGNRATVICISKKCKHPAFHCL